MSSAALSQALRTRCNLRYATTGSIQQNSCYFSCLSNLDMASGSERRNVPGYLKGTASTASRAESRAKRDVKADIDAASLFTRGEDDRPSFSLALNKPEQGSAGSDQPLARTKTPPLNTHYALIGQHSGLDQHLDDSWGAQRPELLKHSWLSTVV